MPIHQEEEPSQEPVLPQGITSRTQQPVPKTPQQFVAACMSDVAPSVSSYHEQYVPSEQPHQSPLLQDSDEEQCIVEAHGSSIPSHQYRSPLRHRIRVVTNQAGGIDDVHVHGEQPKISLSQIQEPISLHGHPSLRVQHQMDGGSSLPGVPFHGKQYTIELPRQSPLPQDSQELHTSLSSYPWTEIHATLQAHRVDDALVHSEQSQSQIQEPLVPHSLSGSDSGYSEPLYAVAQGSLSPVRSYRNVLAEGFDTDLAVPVRGLRRSVQHQGNVLSGRQPSGPCKLIKYSGINLGEFLQMQINFVDSN